MSTTIRKPSTLRPALRAADGVPSDEYAEVITNLRLYRDEAALESHEHAWAIDGYDTVTETYTEDMEWYQSFAEAVAALPAFAAAQAWRTA